jgi:hypothetical protein
MDRRNASLAGHVHNTTAIERDGLAAGAVVIPHGLNPTLTLVANS